MAETESGSTRPRLIFIAGPNGAGKTTLTEELRQEESLEGIPVVNPDAIARHLDPQRPERQAFEAGRQAIRRVRSRLQRRESVAVETTFSGRRGVRLIHEARQAGFRVELIYVGVSSPEMAVFRVRERMAAGGHAVPPEEVVRRYHRSLENLRAAAPAAHEVRLFDNSGAGPRPVLTARQGRILRVAPAVPTWVRRALGADLSSGDTFSGGDPQRER